MQWKSKGSEKEAIGRHHRVHQQNRFESTLLVDVEFLPQMASGCGSVAELVDWKQARVDPSSKPD